MAESPRSLGREIALKALYAIEHGEVEPDSSFSNIMGNESIPPKSIKYARELLALVRRETEWADAQIERLAVNWEIERLAAIDRTIMRIAMVEIEHMVDVPVKVALNEAIELAKKFSSPQSSGFVNGILDNFVKGREKAEG